MVNRMDIIMKKKNRIGNNLKKKMSLSITFTFILCAVYTFYFLYFMIIIKEI